MTELQPPQAAEAADILWFVPTHGDGRYLGTQEGAREVCLHYMNRMAAADDNGYFRVLLPTAALRRSAWIAASALAPQTPALISCMACGPGLSRRPRQRAWRQH